MLHLKRESHSPRRHYFLSQHHNTCNLRCGRNMLKTRIQIRQQIPKMDIYSGECLIFVEMVNMSQGEKKT